MKKLFLPLLLAIYLLAPGYAIAQLSVVNHKPYAEKFYRQPLRPYSDRITADRQDLCGGELGMRSTSEEFPGDYFWPTWTHSNGGRIKRPDSEQKRQIMQFIKDYFTKKFQDPSLIDSAQEFTYECSYAPVSIRREFYLMLSDGDTIYVISGWFGKFMSLFRATPYDKRLTPADFIAEAKAIAPALGKFGLSDSSVKVKYYPVGYDTTYVVETYDKDEHIYWMRRNHVKIENYIAGYDTTYFMDAYDTTNSLWLRHYPIKVVLPPNDPKKGKEKTYNLIEISRIYDREMFDLRRQVILHSSY